jgi:hypothetical protein
LGSFLNLTAPGIIRSTTGQTHKFKQCTISLPIIDSAEFGALKEKLPDLSNNLLNLAQKN